MTTGRRMPDVVSIRENKPLNEELGTVHRDCPNVRFLLENKHFQKVPFPITDLKDS